MRILGIDTSLYSTCAAVTENSSLVLANIVRVHDFKNDHLFDFTLNHCRYIGETIMKALKTARIKMEDIGLVAVNNFSSQVSNVFVGLSAAKTLSALFHLPLVGVGHREAHFFSCFLERDFNEFKFPIVVFSASGAHSAFILIENKKFIFHNLFKNEDVEESQKGIPDFQGLGAIYGSVAYALGIGTGIGGAPLLSEAAKSGNPSRFNLFFRRSAKNNITDFSFLKLGVSNFLARYKEKNKFSRRFIADFAASFEHSVSEIVLNDLVNIAKKYKAREIHIVGGISANRIFRQKLPIFAKKIGVRGLVPAKLEYCTDNAAMIASLGYYRYRQHPKKYSRGKIDLITDLRLEKMAVEQILDINPKENLFHL